MRLTRRNSCARACGSARASAVDAIAHAATLIRVANINGGTCMLEILKDSDRRLVMTLGDRKSRWTKFILDKDAACAWFERRRRFWPERTLELPLQGHRLDRHADDCPRQRSDRHHRADDDVERTAQACRRGRLHTQRRRAHAPVRRARAHGRRACDARRLAAVALGRARGDGSGRHGHGRCRGLAGRDAGRLRGRRGQQGERLDRQRHRTRADRFAPARPAMRRQAAMPSWNSRATALAAALCSTPSPNAGKAAASGFAAPLPGATAGSPASATATISTAGRQRCG